MEHQQDSRSTFAATSMRPKRKKIIEIFVSGGSFSKPHYTFSDKQGRLIDNLKLNVSKTYRFRRFGNATTHPFYISDAGVNQPATKNIKLRGDGKFNDGITGTETFTVSIKSKHHREFKKSGQLFFYCTSHASMADEFSIKSRRRQPLSRSLEQGSTTLKAPTPGRSLEEGVHSTFNGDPYPFTSKSASSQESMTLNSEFDMMISTVDL